MDLTVHTLMHTRERPEKCPVESCEWHTKGFIRISDRNRHTLTHYKGTMVCPFCPVPGTAYGKEFNQVDVFKRHLTMSHIVEQTPPNSRELILSSRSRPGIGEDDLRVSGTGLCSICYRMFLTAQEFYEHLDDCVFEVIEMLLPDEWSSEGSQTPQVDTDPATND